MRNTGTILLTDRPATRRALELKERVRKVQGTKTFAVASPQSLERVLNVWEKQKGVNQFFIAVSGRLSKKNVRDSLPDVCRRFRARHPDTEFHYYTI